MKESISISELYSLATAALPGLIAVPSVSRSEDKSAAFIEKLLGENGIPVHRIENNVWATGKHFHPSRPTLLLNSHHDTVPPNSGYTNDPWKPVIRDGKIFGLGSNDAGGPLISLLAVFIKFYEADLPFNIVFAASAEEEVSGKNGMELLLQHLPRIDMGIVGEPTQMKMAIAEKGLLVLDAVAKGVSGHAARDDGENALYKAVEDIHIIRQFHFEKTSELLGPVHLAVTSIESQNKSHNVIPDECAFVVDVRVNEHYSFEEVLRILGHTLKSELIPRSLRLRPSFISPDHPLVQAGIMCGMSTFGSATLSDMALMNFPAIKLGPGDSLRSHTPDEFIFIGEIEAAITTYIQLIYHLAEILKPKK